MKIHGCEFSVEHPTAGLIHGRYRDGKVHFSGTSSFPTTDNRWSGSTYHSEENQAIYLDLLQAAVKIKGNLFK